MTQQSAAYSLPRVSDAGAQIAQLRQVLPGRGMAGRAATGSARRCGARRSARIGAAYARALPIDQKRFDALAAETACWAAAAVEALLKLDDAAPAPDAAAGRLAEELGKGLRALGRLLRV